MMGNYRPREHVRCGDGSSGVKRGYPNDSATFRRQTEQVERRWCGTKGIIQLGAYVAHSKKTPSERSKRHEGSISRGSVLLLVSY
jgi:hypothetical protein